MSLETCAKPIHGTTHIPEPKKNPHFTLRALDGKESEHLDCRNNAWIGGTGKVDAGKSLNMCSKSCEIRSGVYNDISGQRLNSEWERCKEFEKQEVCEKVYHRECSETTGRDTATRWWPSWKISSKV